MPPIKNIIFDYGGVLLNLAPEKCISQFIQLGCPPSLFKGPFWTAGIFQRINVGTATEAEFYDEIRRIGQIPKATDQQILEAWNSFITGTDDIVFENLKKLKEQYPLFLLSNINLMHWRYSQEHLLTFRGENVIPWFRHLFLSFEMHLEKPFPEIYHAVINKAEIRAEETLFIDDRAENIAGATAVGLQTLLSTDKDWLTNLHTLI